MKTFYTNEKNTLIIIDLLKKYGIKKIIASPGATNVSFVASVQSDCFFEIYSAVDERSAAFMAYGLAEESNEPVVLSCTGATASRNYLPGITESYYCKVPILVITSTVNTGKIGYYVPQLIDRTQPYNDMVQCSLQIPTIRSWEDEKICVVNINKGLNELLDSRLPVHINLTTTYSNVFSIKKLPNCRVIRRINSNSNFPTIPKGKIAIFIGAHLPFNSKMSNLIDSFCEKYNAVAICDQTSNYRGKYRFLAALSDHQEKILTSRFFNLVIHIGSISGAYLRLSANEVWRVNMDGEFRDLFGSLTYTFKLSELDFFDYYVNKTSEYLKSSESLIETCNLERTKLISKIKNLPYSNLWVARELSNDLPPNSVLHLGILNSLRAWNYFETPSTVTCYSNTGGFGIDGCLSTVLGAAINDDKEYFIVLGDLAFFYDMNSLCNRIPNNIHILVINNGLGIEFKNYNHRVAMFGEDANLYMAAEGHNGKKSSVVLSEYAKKCGLSYLSASNKEEFNDKKGNFLKSKTPVLFEIFTNELDESNALKKINSLETDRGIRFKTIVKEKIKRFVKKILRR